MKCRNSSGGLESLPHTNFHFYFALNRRTEPNGLELEPHLRYAGPVLTVKRGKITLHFVIREFMRRGKDRSLQPTAGHVRRELWFGANLFAEEFLRILATDHAAARGMANLLAELEGKGQPDVLNNAWIQPMAAQLVSGRVMVIEVAPSAVAGTGSSSEKSKSTRKEMEPAFPRKPAVAPARNERRDTADQPTFTNLDDDDQTRSLVAASKSGKPFLQVCNKT